MSTILGVTKRMKVYRKANISCSICGSTDNLTCDHFIPKWTRVVGNDEPNLIPLCSDCNTKKDCNFININKLQFLKEGELIRIMIYYKGIQKYLRKYVKEYGSYRTDGKLDVDLAMATLNSYDLYILDNNI